MNFVLPILLFVSCSEVSKAKFDPVAFTVSQYASLSVTNETVLPYPHTITNHMNRNEISNGVFTSTTGGTFKCQVYSLADSNKKIFLEIWHNDHRVASLYAHSPSYGSGGNAVVLTLAEGDTVQVKTRINYRVDAYDVQSQIYNTFTCVQIGSEAISTDDKVISAFSVTSNRNQNVVGGKSVMYNTVLVDINNAFNLDTGIFTAPTSGIYIFHFFSLAHQNEELWQDMFQNDKYICSIKCVTDFEWTGTGNTVILHLNINDTVTVKAHAGVDNYLFGKPDQIFTTFSGVQVITDLDMLSPESYPIVAFSVALTHNVTVATGSIVLYDKVFVNYKNAYDITTGRFVAPASGIYEFNYHGRTLRGSDIYLRLMHNQRYVNSIYDYISGHHATAGNAAVLELLGGDVVRIESQGGTNKLYGDPSEIYCTFSGYLLHSITPVYVNAKFDPIAFTIALDTDQKFTGATILPYPYVITNHMQSNGISNGVFTSPQSGTFKCQVYSMAFQDGKIFLDLMHNNHTVASIYGHIRNGYATGGNAVVLSLTKGDTVKVKTRANQTVSLYGTENYNTFTCSQVGSQFLSQNNASVPAFSAISDRNQEIIAGSPVIYNRKLIDTANCFDSNNGFLVPSDGIYIFQFFGLPMQNEELWHDMFVNDKYMCSARSKTDFEWAISGNTIILHLHKNDSVIIKAHATADSYLFGNSDQRFTTFSGVQIIPDRDAQSPDIYPAVAFSVGLAQNLTARGYQNITFDRVFTNYGNAFNLTSGVFVAPVTGVYEFNYHFMGRVPDDPIYLQMIHNVRQVGGIYSQASGLHSTVGNAAVLNLVGGDSVRIFTKANTSLYGDPSEIYCIFSGYLLHAVSPAEIVVGK